MRQFLHLPALIWAVLYAIFLMYSPASPLPSVMIRTVPQEMTMESTTTDLSMAVEVRARQALFCQETVTGLRQRTAHAKLFSRRITSERSLVRAEHIERSSINDATVSECVDRARSEIAEVTTRRIRRHHA